MAQGSKKLSTEAAILERRALHSGSAAGYSNLRTIPGVFIQFLNLI